jgi:hypothetical protein
MHGDVPLAAKLEPVAAIPPVRVELSICEACMPILAAVEQTLKDILQVISAKAPQIYSKMTRKTRRKETINGKRSLEIVSARIRPRSEIRDVLCMAIADSAKTGMMNSSLVTVRRNMQPKMASDL